MPRAARNTTATGIYHVMMRGINHQVIFEDKEDYNRFLGTLEMMAKALDPDGRVIGCNYTLYAYCLMSNHFHLLIRERQDNVAMAVKRIASSYVYYYNRKYGRDGHLFRERFRSEPVNDFEYFLTLLRYIHQNPVKAGIVAEVKDYAYSSWGEYSGTVEPVFQLCDTKTVLKNISFPDLEAIVNEPLPDDVGCIDIEDPEKARPSDDQVWRMIQEMTGVTYITAFQQLPEDIRIRTLLVLRNKRASVRQVSRLTGFGKNLIHRIWLRYQGQGDWFYLPSCTALSPLYGRVNASNYLVRDYFDSTLQK